MLHCISRGVIWCGIFNTPLPTVVVVALSAEKRVRENYHQCLGHVSNIWKSLGRSLLRPWPAVTCVTGKRVSGTL